ncbi:MAG: energy transducer TonB, partial [Candidatus Omnitrophica bacterium]|nr:energy transducer TonB [Candidatus Omnitrophota bacterium]
KDTVTEHNDKVPILGDIPILGKLFSTKGKSKEKTELVIFITPHIIDPDKSAKEAEFYAKEWEKKAEDAKIEKPEEPKLKSEKPGRKKSAKAKQKQKPGPKKKTEWTPVFDKKEPEKKKVLKEEKEEVVKTPYEAYYLAIRKEIMSAAEMQDMGGLTGDVELQFTLDRDGFLTKGPIVLNKPDLKLVRAAVNCVKLTSPFFPFPKGLNKEEAEFYIVVRYE